MEADRRCGKEILGPWVVKQDLVVENAARVGMSARLLTLLENLRLSHTVHQAAVLSRPVLFSTSVHHEQFFSGGRI